MKLAAAAALALALTVSPTVPPGNAMAQDWPYQWPVAGPVIDGFRAPANPYGPGNRGLEFATIPGTTVVAAGDGSVVFAGSVAGSSWVTIQHPDGVRTSYGPLAGVAVVRGSGVGRGAVIGTSGARLHVSARVGEAYIDPAILFGQRGRAHLVPNPRSTVPGSPPSTMGEPRTPEPRERGWGWLPPVVSPGEVGHQVAQLLIGVTNQLRESSR